MAYCTLAEVLADIDLEDASDLVAVTMDAEIDVVVANAGGYPFVFDL